MVEIVAAALIPFLTGHTFNHKDAVIGGLGVLITILEGILQLNQYQQIWTTYRATGEALTREKYLFQALAGPYAAPGVNPPVLLAERIEAMMSQENTKWVSLQEQQNQKKPMKRAIRTDAGRRRLCSGLAIMPPHLHRLGIHLTRTKSKLAVLCVVCPFTVKVFWICMCSWSPSGRNVTRADRFFFLVIRSGAGRPRRNALHSVEIYRLRSPSCMCPEDSLASTSTR